ncbi:MAG TPA: hypothetical protein VGR50_04420 [Terriglobales bacterium]|nr:hypothetical protein [Terriglobales bacterium]
MLEWSLIALGLVWMALYVVWGLTRPDPHEDFMLDLLATELGEDQHEPRPEGESHGGAARN